MARMQRELDAGTVSEFVFRFANRSSAEKQLSVGIWVLVWSLTNPNPLLL